MAYITDNRKWLNHGCQITLGGPQWPQLWDAQIRGAMGVWNAAGASFRFSAEYPSPNMIACYDLTAWNGWLAMTYTEPRIQGSNLTSAQILMNMHYEWSPAHPTVPFTVRGPYDLQTVLIHELGHVLHLGDDMSGVATVMSPTLKPTTRRSLHQDDIDGIRYLYPANPGPNRSANGQLIQLSVADLGALADVILRGTVLAGSIAIPAILHADERVETLFTIHSVLVRSVLKGSSLLANRTVRVRTLGGDTGERSVDVTSEARLSPGEEVALFLSNDTLGFSLPIGEYDFTIYGGFQGKYTILGGGDNPLVRNSDSDSSSSGSAATLEEIQSQLQVIAGAEVVVSVN